MKLLSVILFLTAAAFAQHISASQLDSAQVNGVFYLSACNSPTPASWCSGSDVGAWLNAAVAACPRQNNGLASCQIWLPETGTSNPNGMNWSTPAVIPNSQISLYGYGVKGSKFNCNMIGTTAHPACLQVINTSRFDVYTGGVLSGFRIDGGYGHEGPPHSYGTNSAYCIQVVDYTGLTMINVSCNGFNTDTASGGFWFRDSKWWSEQDLLLGISARNNSKDIRFTVDPEDTYTSFGYFDIVGAHFQTKPTASVPEPIVLSVENNSNIYHGHLEFRYNKDDGGVAGHGGIVIHTQDAAMVGSAPNGVETVDIEGEDGSGSTGGLVFDIAAGTNFNYCGPIDHMGAARSNVRGTALPLCNDRWSPGGLMTMRPLGQRDGSLSNPTNWTSTCPSFIGCLLYANGLYNYGGAGAYFGYNQNGTNEADIITVNSGGNGGGLCLFTTTTGAAGPCNTYISKTGGISTTGAIAPASGSVPPKATLDRLPACSAGLEGVHAVATNCSASCSAGAACTPGGSIHCELYCGSSSSYIETGH